jgi:hypothetical protein
MLQEFEKMKLFTFHLRRQGAYYYLHPNVPAHLRAANSTLELGPFSSGSDALQRDELGGSRSREPSGPDTSDAVQVCSCQFVLHFDVLCQLVLPMK